MINVIFILVLVSCSFAANAKDTLSFGVVPQQSASKLARLWGPIFKYLEKETEVKINFETAPDIPAFEKNLAAGKYDLSYMNPYHYVVFSKKAGYKAFGKARDKKIKGIFVVRKNSVVNELKDLNNSTLAFPAPAAFAASILTRSALSRDGVTFTPKYVSSHDSVYRVVAKGLYPSGGGVVRTFMNVAPEIREQLRILWTSKGYTPHAIASHPRVKIGAVKKIQKSLIGMEHQSNGRVLLKGIKIKGFEAGRDSDWDDVRLLGLNLINLD
jgi:phosphonate transport system substrate-binding protein